jgi:hypothetical protein
VSAPQAPSALAAAVREEPRATSPLLDAKAAGALLGVPPTWLLREARADRIPHRRFGKYVRWSPEDLYWIIESRASGPRTGNGPTQRRRNAR